MADKGATVDGGGNQEEGGLSLVAASQLIDGRGRFYRWAGALAMEAPGSGRLEKREEFEKTHEIGLVELR